MGRGPQHFGGDGRRAGDADFALTSSANVQAALQEQAEAAASGSPLDLDAILRRFPELAGQRDARLALVYHENLLCPKSTRQAHRQELLTRHPDLADELSRQFRFRDLLEMHGAITISDQPLQTIIDELVSNDSTSGANFEVVTEGETVFVPRHIGRFEVERLVGRGGMGLVFLAHDQTLDRPVAIKVPNPRGRSKRKLDERLVREAKIAARLRHPNLAEIYEATELSRGSYLVIRWADGGSLYDFLMEHPEPVPEMAALWLMEGIVAGLTHCHASSVTHLDLKPGNILFDTGRLIGDGTDHGFAAVRGEAAAESEMVEEPDIRRETFFGFPGQPLVTDFGLARLFADEATATQTRAAVGTPFYMAPEQINGDEASIGFHTDVFACGLVLQELLSGEHPRASLSLAEGVDAVRSGSLPPIPRSLNVSADVKRIVARCLDPNPNCRYRSAAELLGDIRKVRSGHRVSGSSLKLWDRICFWCQEPRRVAEAATFTIAVNVGILFSFIAMFVFIWTRWFGEIDIDLSGYLIDSTKLVVFPHLPMIWCGSRILKGKLAWHWANVLMSVAMLLLVLSAFVRGVSPLRAYEGHDFALFTSHNLVFGLSVTMLAANLVSVPALLRLRRLRRQQKMLQTTASGEGS